MWVRGEAVNDAAGNIIGLWGAAQDITERKRAEEELRENENILNITGQMAKIGGWELYPETMKVTWTAETYRIHEVSKSVKPPLEDAINFWHPEDQPILKKAIQQAIDNGIPYDLELRFITAKGRNLYARTKCNPVLRNGKVVKLQGFFMTSPIASKLRKSAKRSSFNSSRPRRWNLWAGWLAGWPTISTTCWELFWAIRNLHC